MRGQRCKLTLSNLCINMKPIVDALVERYSPPPARLLLSEDLTRSRQSQDLAISERDYCAMNAFALASRIFCLSSSVNFSGSRTTTNFLSVPVNG
jgi:hypothetical protein